MKIIHSKMYIDNHDIEIYIDLLTNELKNKNITKIVTLSKGGYIPARMLAKTLDIRRIYSIGMEFYKDEGRTLNEPIIYQNLTEQFSDDDLILLIDDLTDKGESMKVALNEVKKHNGRNIITCSLMHKSKSTFKPDYYVLDVDSDVWVVLPWE